MSANECCCYRGYIYRKFVNVGTDDFTNFSFFHFTMVWKREIGANGFSKILSNSAEYWRNRFNE